MWHLGCVWLHLFSMKNSLLTNFSPKCGVWLAKISTENFSTNQSRDLFFTHFCGKQNPPPTNSSLTSIIKKKELFCIVLVCMQVISLCMQVISEIQITIKGIHWYRIFSLNHFFQPTANNSLGWKIGKAVKHHPRQME